MILSAWWRKFVLTAHIATSVGWLGAVVAFLALAIAGLVARSAEGARAAYTAMDLIGWDVIVPLCLASLVTGLVQSLAGTWGLFRHYWVLIKFLIAVLATLLLVVHMGPTSRLATAAQAGNLESSGLHGLRLQLVVDSTAAVLALVVATILSVYKPQGLTPYGWQKQFEPTKGAGRIDHAC